MIPARFPDSFLAKGDLSMASRSTQAPEVRERTGDVVEIPALPVWPLPSPRREQPTRPVIKLVGDVPA
jgi:hypothetical protein